MNQIDPAEFNDRSACRASLAGRLGIDRVEEEISAGLLDAMTQACELPPDPTATESSMAKDKSGPCGG